jgi:hypothetical protein
MEDAHLVAGCTVAFVEADRGGVEDVGTKGSGWEGDECDVFYEAATTRAMIGSAGRWRRGSVRGRRCHCGR